MFAGFSLSIGNFGYAAPINFSAYQERGKDHLRAQKAALQDDLKRYLLEGTNIPDGTGIQNAWFPEIEADIFISHSHKDIDLAEGLAGWLNAAFGLRCFIDYNVWGYSDTLLDEINSKYSNMRSDGNGGILYDYRSCNAAAKHVDTMLTIALHQMIDRCECVFLLNTDNSIQRYAAVPHDTTNSPWIYSEIVCSQIVRKQPLSNYRNSYVLKHDGLRYAALNEAFTPAYKVTTDHLHPLDVETLVAWSRKYQEKRSPYALDALYALLPDLGTDTLQALYG